jgi:hypothetical protein
MFPIWFYNCMFMFYIRVNCYFPFDWNNGTWSSKCNGKNKFVKKQHFKANRKFTSCYNIKILDYGKKYMLFSLNFAWNRTLLPVLKGNNSCIILESDNNHVNNISLKCVWTLNQILWRPFFDRNRTVFGITQFKFGKGIRHWH